jgi:hypothetical protein
MDIPAAQFRDSCSISIIVYQTLHFEDPLLGALILTHMLQTEVKSKLSALTKGLQREPAFPDGSPERRDHHGSVPGSHPGVPLLSEIRAHCHGQRRPAAALGQHGQHQRLNHLSSGALWVFTSVGTHLRTAARPEATTDPTSGSARQREALAVAQCDTRF